MWRVKSDEWITACTWGKLARSESVMMLMLLGITSHGHSWGLLHGKCTVPHWGVCSFGVARRIVSWRIAAGRICEVE